MTHHDDVMPQFIPEAEPIGTLHLSLNETDESCWHPASPGGPITHIITVDGVGDPEVRIRVDIAEIGDVPLYAVGTLSLSLFLQAAELMRSHYLPVYDGDEGETT